MSRSDSEFACEVVRVTSVQPHPNADRLDVVRFAMLSPLAGTAAGDDPGAPGHQTAYTVVDQRGRRHAGQLAVYCSVDALLPRALGAAAFLFERPESKGKDVHRLRAARLRGVYSEGLLLDAPEGAKLGDDLAEAWGVGYHDPKPEKREPRDLTIGEPRRRKPDWRRSALPEFDVVSLRKAPDLFEVGEEVVVTEKIHGTNMRAGHVRSDAWLLGRYQWVVGSHRVFKTHNASWWRRLMLRFRDHGHHHVGHWYGEDLWQQAAAAHELEEVCRRVAPGIGFYMELHGVSPTGKKIQDLDYGSPVFGLRVFDARDSRSGSWLPWGDVVMASLDIGLDVAPTLYRGAYPGLDKIREMAEGLTTLPSALGGHIREGVVVRSISGDRRGKWVGEGYRMRKEG